MPATTAPTGYSGLQIALPWLVFVPIAQQVAGALCHQFVLRYVALVRMRQAQG